MKKMYFLVSVLFASSTLFASTGQQFREDSQKLADRHNLQILAEIYPATPLCSGGFPHEPLMLMVDSEDDLFYVSMLGFLSEQDSVADRARVIKVSDCSEKTLRF